MANPSISLDRRIRDVVEITMRILVGYNGTDHSNSALEDLRHAGLPDQTEALVISVAEVCFPPENLEKAAYLASLAADRLWKKFPTWSVRSEAASGNPATEILAAAESFKPDLIVFGERTHNSDKHSAHSALLGPAAKTILSEAPCSVRVGRGRLGETTHPERIIVGFDGSRGPEFAVESIAARRWPAGTKVCLLAVADSSVLGSIGRFIPQISNAVLEAKFASQWAETLAAASIAKLTKAGLIASVDVRIGQPKDTIVEMAAASHADCIFVGRHHSTNPIERFLLGVPAAVAAGACCSVEVVRPKA